MNRGYTYGGYRYGGYSLPKTNGLLQKYPEDIQCVYPSSDPNKGAIYVSNVQAASNHVTLSKHNIKAVMTCAKGYDRNIPKQKLQMYQYFPFDDKQTCMISPYFEKASDFIVNALSKTNILVHCIAGVSRSVSMVLAYLIREKGMNYQQAYHAVKSRRSIISPNDGFIRQLKQYALEIRDRMNRVGNKTPVKQRYANNQNNVSPKNNDNNTERIYRTNTKQPDTSQKYKESVANQEDYEIRRGKTDNWIIDNKSTYPNQSYKQGLENRNHSVGFAKSQTFIDMDRMKTPEKVRATHQRYTQVKPTSTYFQQMNEELNQKIQAIHAKYEKQREALLSKRLANATAVTKQHRSFSSKNSVPSTTPYPNRYTKYLDSTQVGTGSDSKKYTNLYENKYARGLDYQMRTGGKVFNIGGGYYRGKYF